MALEAYSQFHAFDWAGNEDWLEYKSKLECPTDSADFLLSKRQKWFKTHVNQDYDPSFKPSSKAAAKPTGEPNSQASAPSEPEQKEKTPAQVVRTSMTLGRVVLLMMNLLVLVHVVLALVNLVTPVLLGYSHFTFAYIHSALSYLIVLFSSVGRPRLSMNWLKSAINNDNTHYVMYSMIFLTSIPRPVSLIPLFIYSVINTSILLPRFLASFNFPIRVVNLASSKVKENKMTLLFMGSNMEVAVFASLIFEMVSGDLGALLPTVLYWNFLSSRWRASAWTQATVNSIEEVLDSYLLSANTPSFVSAIYQQIKGFVRRMSAPRAAAR